jgi:hypothetical protein
MPSKKRSLLAASGSAGESVYVEDVFSTYLYTGNDGSQTLTNGIDLDGEGGMVWQKRRSSSENHIVSDSARGLSGANYKSLSPNNTLVEQTSDSPISSFNTNGFSMDRTGAANSTGETYVSWTFRKAEKFFDVVTYTGTGVANNVAHSIGAVPGFIVCKATSTTSNWGAVHSSIDTYGISLNTTNAGVNKYAASGSTSTTFNPNEISDHLGASMNLNGVTYVAYLFASDAGGFGDDGSESVVSCGSFTTDGTGVATVDLGFEPQWILAKETAVARGWSMLDTMRGLGVGQTSGSNNVLYANASDAEDAGTTRYFNPSATGFTTKAHISSTYIYIAIRRPMKVPEAGTEVFGVDTRGRLNTVVPGYDTTFPIVDLAIVNDITGGSFGTSARLTGTSVVYTNTTASESTGSNAKFDYMNGWYGFAGTNADQISWMFKRATGFMDVVAYTGNSAVSTVDNKSHNLGVVPELIIFKDRSGTDDWQVYHSAIGETKQIRLNMTYFEIASAYMNNTAPTSSVFTANGGFLNSDGVTYIAYLFATLAGVSKVGSYTGTAASLDINMGFAAGARFFLTKRSDAVGDWYFWDYFRGIVAGNDPYMLLNDSAAQVTNTDYVDPLAAGITLTAAGSSTINVSGGTYIFLAIA